MRTRIFFILMLIALMAKAQDANNNTVVENNLGVTLFEKISEQKPKEGKVTFHHDKNVTLLMQKQQQISKSLQSMEGFRVQLYRGNSGAKSKKESESIKSTFTELFPDRKIYVVYNNPIWRVQSGDYRTFGEALLAKSIIEKGFPDLNDQIYVIQTKINIPE